MDINENVLGKRPLVSIMIPAYQAEKFIDRCLNSVIKQTYNSLEILVYNDGSTDGTQAIISEYQKRDKRIVSMGSPNNCGLGVARNRMVLAARGDYYSFVDADDYVEPEFIEKLLSSVMENHTEISICNYLVDKNSEIVSIENGYRGVMNWKEFREEILTERCSSYLWNKLFASQLFHNNLFKEDIVWEDLEWFGRCVFSNCVGKVSFVKEALYYYVENLESIVHKQEKLMFKSQCIAYAFLVRYKLAKRERDRHLIDITLSQLVPRVLSYMTYKKYIADNGVQEYDAEINNILGVLNVKEVLSMKYLSLGGKLQYMLYVVNTELFLKLKKRHLGI